MNSSQWKIGDRTFFSLEVDDQLLLLGNTIWTKPMWAVVFYDWNIFVGWDNTENIFIGGCEVYEGMIGNRPAEDQVLLGLSRNVGG